PYMPLIRPCDSRCTVSQTTTFFPVSLFRWLRKYCVARDCFGSGGGTELYAFARGLLRRFGALQLQLPERHWLRLNDPEGQGGLLAHTHAQRTWHLHRKWARDRDFRFQLRDRLDDGGQGR